MLSRLYIRNYALIEHLDLHFETGFTTITGETGSGKSIMLGALSLVLGERADTSVVHSVSEKCIVEAEFQIFDREIEYLFNKLDVDFDEHSLFRREINPKGKSRAFINDMPVSLSAMKEIGEELIDIHSQHQTLKLNRPNFQLQMLDVYANNKDRLIEYKKTFNDWTKAKLELLHLNKTRENLLTEIDFVKFQLTELKDAELSSVDYEKIHSDFQLISAAKEILSAIENTKQDLSFELGAIDKLNNALIELKSIREKHHKLNEFFERLNSVQIELEDIDNEIEQFKQTIDIDPAKTEVIREKLDVLNHLLFKHRVSSVKELFEIQTELESKLYETDNLDSSISDLESRIEILYNKLSEQAIELSKNRTKTSALLSKRCENVLKDLNMSQVKLTFSLEELNDFNSFGKDKVQLNFSPDNGKTVLPIQKVASGGEVSRVMLSIKSLLARKTVLPTIIFDEIDTGVSGQVASSTGQILKDMSTQMQVIAITHLPQVAALGNRQYLVDKSTRKDKPVTTIVELDRDARVKEIAKMLSANKITDEAMANAQILLENQ